MKDWNAMDSGELSKKDLREGYISIYGVTLHAFGKLGNYFFNNPELKMQDCLKGLSNIDWSRSNLSCWGNRAINTKGQINRNERGIFLTYVKIKRLLSLEINDEEHTKELQYYEREKS